MHSGKDLGTALKEAMDLKKVRQDAVAHEFGVSQPSVSEWCSLGRIHKKHIPKLLSYFADVVGPDHWGLPFSRDEFDLVLAFRELHPSSQQTLLANVKKAANQEAASRRRSVGLLTAPEENAKAA